MGPICWTHPEPAHFLNNPTQSVDGSDMYTYPSMDWATVFICMFLFQNCY